MVKRCTTGGILVGVTDRTSLFGGGVCLVRSGVIGRGCWGECDLRLVRLVSPCVLRRACGLVCLAMNSASIVRCGEGSGRFFGLRGGMRELK